MKIRNWDQFQGYQKRGPQWIKLHVSLIHDPAWLTLSTAARAVLPALWLAASQQGVSGELPDDVRLLSILCHCPVQELSEAIPELAETRFILCDKSVAGSATDVSQGLRQKCRERRDRDRDREETELTSADADALAVYNHWLEKANTEQRSDKVREATLKRIRARLKDGFSVADLTRAVDVACWDEFYVQRGYYRRPDVIWRNAERVQSLLAKAQHEAARPVPL